MEETMAPQVHKGRWFWLLLEGLLLLVGVPLGAYFLLYRQVRPVTIWEMTGSCPDASVVMKDGSEARFAFDTGKIDWTHPGDAVVLVAGKLVPRVALIRLQDTTAPAARGVPQVLGMDEELGPDAFLSEPEDAQLVGVSFEEAPVFHVPGEYPVTIRLEDLSGNVGYVKTSCTVLGPTARIDIEAGETVPPLSAFLPRDTTGRFVTDVAALDTRVPGAYTIEVEAEGQTFEAALIVSDTVAPTCTFVTEVPYTRTGQALAPESLVTSASDVSALTYGFDPAPRWDEQGYQTVTVTVTDAGGNRVKGTVTVLVSDLMPLTWEASRWSVAGTAVATRQKELDESFAGEVKMERFVPRKVGCFDVNATVDDVPCIQRLFVVDTTAPLLAFPKKPVAYLDHPVAPRALLHYAEDETPLTLTYLIEPDWTREGAQTVSIAAVDAVGNRTEITGTVNIIRDTVPPNIQGVVDQFVYIGEAVSYFGQAVATDNADEPEDISLTVNNSAVNIYREGRYPVTYRATDRAGNTTKKTVYLTFIRPTVSDADLQAAADKILDQIVADDMTLGQKAFAIYCYVYDTYRFTERIPSNKRDWKYEAYRGLTTRRGDCFTYCSAAKVLLEKIGAKVMFVMRKSANRHYWLMVDLGTGWYHFDPLNSGPSRRYQCFMLTTEEALGLYRFFWQYDRKIYPNTPNTPFVWDW